MKFFEKALASSNVYVRRAAAEELANMMYDGVELSAVTLERIRRETSGPWAASLNMSFDDAEKVLGFLLGSGSFRPGEAVPFASGLNEAIPNEAMFYALRECEKHSEAFFSETEAAAIEGHFAVSRNRYGEALGFFRVFQEEGKWPAQIPGLFLRYPILINDLGRAFQYTSFGSEGIELFLQWEKTLTEGQDADQDLRFRLLFYAGRIARRLGRSDLGISLFEMARPLAPETEQADACIWYILDSSMSRGSDAVIRQLEQFAPHWHDGAYFDDILERLSRELVSKREWKNLINVFTFIQDQGAAVSTARYAWITARAIEEGYLSAEEMQLAAKAANAAEAANTDADVAANATANATANAAANATALAEAASFKRIAYNAGDTSFYYRSQSADSLGEPFLELPAAAGTTDKPSPVLKFLLGFFTNDVSEFAPGYIKSHERELNPVELRALADALEKAGMYVQSMRLVSLYINREGYNRDRRDLELLFPRPFMELTEKYASEMNIPPAILFGLIRTESAFQSAVVSRAGAVGLTQLMPATAEEMAARIKRAGGPDYSSADSGLDLGDPSVNIHIGSYYLNYLLGRFDGNILLSLLAYNGGMNRIRRWRAANPMPPDLFMETITIHETREYGRKVMAAAAVYQYLYY